MRFALLAAAILVACSSAPVALPDGGPCGGACGAGTVCDNGRCVLVDGGVNDAPATDAPATDAPAALDATADAVAPFDGPIVAPIDAATTEAGTPDAGTGALPDGCVSTTVGNCCGVACTAMNNAAPACVGGACGVGACMPGYTDCDGDPRNGCEASLGGDRANCGACGAACAPGRVCNDSACVPCGERSVCGNYCIATQTDRSNCGACGTVCQPGPQGTPVCAAGSCGLTCSSNYGNCDADLGNGCETLLQNNRAHCGACGTVCGATQRCDVFSCVSCGVGAIVCDNRCVEAQNNILSCGTCGNMCPTGPHAGAVCAAGSCSLRCEPGYGNCDGVATNGCETQLNTVEHCGTCTTRCTGTFGFCRPPDPGNANYRCF
ncbi:MAG: uncharacterized protein JWM10_4516 [Myxococcaceae bacterium]|nr:uncharacterized protein [Myxococcaceae bacterium]